MIKTENNKDLLVFNTFGISVVADRLVWFSDPADLSELLSKGLLEDKWMVIGGGSNLLFKEDYHGAILKSDDRSITCREVVGDTVLVEAGAGVVWDEFVHYCVTNDLWGAENLSYIPGTVGAAPVQNVGAYGAEAGDIIHSVTVFRPSRGRVEIISNKECRFGYRDSVFKNELRGDAIVTSVLFSLSRQPRPQIGYGDLDERVEALGGPSIGNIRQGVISIRKQKLPDPAVTGNAGSFFKNPVVTVEIADALKEQYPEMPLYPAAQQGMAKLAAGWLIDRAGWRGRTLGRAAVHQGQALVLVNTGGATADEIIELAQCVMKDVREQFGVDLHPEVSIV